METAFIYKKPLCSPKTFSRNFEGKEGVQSAERREKEKQKFQPRILYLTGLMFRTEGKIQNFQKKQKLKMLITTKQRKNSVTSIGIS